MESTRESNEPRPLLTADEVALRLRASRPSVYRWAREGRLPSFRVGAGAGALRFDADELAAWLEQRRSDIIGEGS